MKTTILARAGISALFFVSGAAALVYEILWTRQFVTVFGNSAYSISIVLCAFMAGLGFGGLYFGKRADRTADPLKLYAFLELGIAATALLIPWITDLLRDVTPGFIALLPGDLLSVSVVRLVFTFLVLFVPCVLIGGTLPVLARFCVDAREVVGQRIGILYGLNTLGGAFGCLLAGFFLLETLGVLATGRAAAGANIAIALIALLIRRTGASTSRESAAAVPQGPADVSNHGESPESNGRGILLALAFLSGFTALSCEILWARFLAFICHSNPYTFTTILGLFLVGLAVGSLIYRFFLARRAARAAPEGRLLMLGSIQILIALAVLAALLCGAWIIASSGPKAQPRIMNTGILRHLGSDFVRQVMMWPLLNALIFVFIPTVIMGIVFPLLCAAFTRSVGVVGRSVGYLYGLNTAGCIVGSLAPVFVMIPLMGIQNSFLFVILLNAGVGALLIVFSGIHAKGSSRRRRALIGAAGFLAVLAACLAAPAGLTKTIFLKGLLTVGPQSEIVHYGEGRTGTSIVLRDRIDGMPDLYINSVLEVPTTYLAQGIFRLMGHMGPLLHPDPKEPLVICFGGGIAGGALNLHPSVEKLQIVDLESSVIEAAKVLWRENNSLHESEKLEIVIEDGRNFLLVSRRKYPVILCDSTHPKSSDSWVLYTREYYETVDRCLADPGVFIQWLPYHGISEDEFKIIVRTFQSVFPHMSLWVVYGYNERGTLGGHSIMVGMKPGFSIDLDNMAQRLSDRSVAADLAPFEMDTPLDILRHFVCGPESLRRWTEGLPVNVDDLPLTQYHTEYYRPPMSHHSMFVPLLESAWPYLRNTGGAEARTELEEKLRLCLEADRLAMQERWKDAHDLLPDDNKLDLQDRIFQQSRRWWAVKRERYTSR